MAIFNSYVKLPEGNDGFLGNQVWSNAVRGSSTWVTLVSFWPTKSYFCYLGDWPWHNLVFSVHSKYSKSTRTSAVEEVNVATFWENPDANLIWECRCRRHLSPSWKTWPRLCGKLRPRSSVVRPTMGGYPNWIRLVIQKYVWKDFDGTLYSE